MLQPTPSQLSTFSGHSHFKKIWLLQTQRENHACENANGHSNGNYSPLSSGTPPSRASALTAVRPARSLVACGSYNGSPHGARRRTSLISCAESSSPPRPPNFPCSLSSHVMPPNRNAEDQALLDGVENYTTFKWTRRSCSPSSPLRSTSLGDPPHDSLDKGGSIKQALSDSSQSRSYTTDHDLSSMHEEDYQANSDARYNAILGTQLSAVKHQAQSSRDFQVGIHNFTSDSSSDTENSAQNKDFNDALRRQSGSKVQVLHQSEFTSHRNKSSHSLLGRESVDVHGGFSRVCSTCGTTKTPLWRTGPHGPKSLCNACGIRYKKAKRSSQDEIYPGGSPRNAKMTDKSLKRKQDMMVGSGSGWNKRSNCQFAYVDITHQPLKRNTWLISRMQADTERQNGNPISPIAVMQHGHPWELRCSSATSLVSEVNKPVDYEMPIAVNRNAAKEDKEAAFLLMYLSSGLINA